MSIVNKIHEQNEKMRNELYAIAKKKTHDAIIEEILRYPNRRIKYLLSLYGNSYLDLNCIIEDMVDNIIDYYDGHYIGVNESVIKKESTRIMYVVKIRFIDLIHSH